MTWKEKLQEQTNSKYINEVYKKIFGEDVLIKRSSQNNLNDITMMLDQKFGIDAQIKLTSGCKLTAQEKILQFSKSHFNQLTIEFLNNTPDDNNNGDWFHNYSQMYFFGYTNEAGDGLLKWWIFNTFNLMFYLTSKIGIDTLKEKYLRRNPSPAKSSFFAIPISLLENKNLIMFHS